MSLILRRPPADNAPLVLGYHCTDAVDSPDPARRRPDTRILPHVPESWGLATQIGGYLSPAVVADARRVAGPSPLVLVGWSAGCQAVRALLRAGVEPLAVVALDGAHASLPVEPWQIETWADYARRGLLVLTATRQTYVERLPRPYASTLRVASMLVHESMSELDGIYPLGRGQVEIHPSARIDRRAHEREVTEHLPRILREIVVPQIEGSPAPVEQSAEPTDLGARVLDVARGELARGVAEVPDGSNTGPDVRRYLAPCVRGGRRVGLTAGEWCAAFASSCVWLAEWAPLTELGERPAAWDMNRGATPPPIGYRCAVHELVTDARASGAWRGPEEAEVPRPGDLLIFGRGGSDPTRGGLGHVAICEAWSASSKSAISGNDGNAVRRREWSSESPWGPLLGWITPRRGRGARCLRRSRRWPR